MNKTITTGIMLFIFLGTLTAGGPWPQKKGKDILNYQNGGSFLISIIPTKD